MVSRQILLSATLLAVSSLLHAQPQTPLRVMSFAGGANLPLWVAEDKGWFTRERLAVSLSSAPNSVALFQSLDKGEQDIALAAFDNVVAYQEGQGEVALSTRPDFFAFMGFTSGTVRLVVDPGIRGYDDLRGKSLAVDAVTTGYSLVLKKLLQLGGLKEGDYHLVPVGATKTRAQGLMENRFSGTILTTPLEILPESRGYRRLANLIDVLGPYQTIVGISRRGWATENHRTLVGFIHASTAALEWLFDQRNRDEATAIYRKHMPDAPGDSAAREVNALLDEREGLSRGGSLDSEGMMTVLRIRSELGMPRKSLTDSTRYVDERYRLAAAGR
jgi:ABC-type nitrate/sulfonate/bicarbonate transport system substrate-binding protein